MIRFQKILFILLVTLIAAAGCMEEINESVEPGYNVSSDILTYLETSGDFINTDQNPAFMSAELVLAHQGSSLLLDIRSAFDYGDGHIENSINVTMESLIETIDNRGSEYERIVIISSSGQKAAYTAALLRMYGYPNVYSMEYGMGRWNEKFADVWINARNDSRYVNYLTRVAYAKPLLKKNMPRVLVDDPSIPTEQMVKQRIRMMLTEAEYGKSIASTDDYEDAFSNRHKEYLNTYIICYGGLDLYNYIRILREGYDPPRIIGGHPKGAVYYDPANDFKASTYLLTLPVDRQIFVYSYNGQRSAYINAYLRLLGYNVRSIEFGGVSMFYNQLSYSRDERSFWISNVRNFPYVQ